MNSECMCTKELMPVCYGKTRFDNRCLAACAGISKDLLAECPNDNNNNDDQKPEIDEPAACICPMMFEPVCFNGKRYNNKCLAACNGVTETQLESCNNGIDPVPPGDDNNQDNNGGDEEDDKPNCAVVDCPNFSAPFCGPDEVLSSRPLNACCNAPVCVKKPDVVDCSTVRCGYFRMAFPAKECPEGYEWQAVTTPPKCCPDHYECVRSETDPDDTDDTEQSPKTCYDYGRNRVVQHGETFSVGCNTCSCFDGDVSCTMNDCSSVPQPDCRVSMNMCQAGYQCVSQEVQCIRAPCDPVFACVPISDSVDTKDCYASPSICGTGGLTSCALSYQCVGVDGTTPETCKKVGTCQTNLYDQSTPHFMCKGQKCAVLRVGIVNTDRRFDVNSVNTCSLLQDLFVKPKNRESLSFSCSTYINQPVAMAARDGHDQREKEEEENPAPSNFILIAVESTKCSRSAAKVIKHMKEQFSSGLLQVNYPETLSYFTADNVDIVATPEKDNGNMSSFRAFLARVARYAGFGSLVVCAVGFLVFIVAHCYYKREARIAAAGGGSGSGKCCNNKNRCVFSRMMIAAGLKKSPSPPSYDDYDSNNDKVALTKAYFAGTESTGSFAPAPFSSNFSNNNTNNTNNNGKKGGDYKPLESVVFKMDDTPKSESNL